MNKPTIFCIIGDNSLLLLHGTKIQNGAFLPFVEDGHHVYKHTITQCINLFFKDKEDIPVYIMFDISAQNFINHKFAKILTGKSLQSAINAKMRSDLPHGAITHAFRTSSTEKDKDFQMFAISETEYSRKILLDIIKLPNPICGYISMPIEIASLMDANTSFDILPQMKLISSDPDEGIEEDEDQNQPNICIYSTKLSGTKIVVYHQGKVYYVNTIQDELEQSSMEEQILYAVQSAIQYCEGIEEDSNPKVIIYGSETIAHTIVTQIHNARIYFVSHQDMLSSKMMNFKDVTYSGDESESFDIIFASLVARKAVFRPTSLMRNHDYINLRNIFTGFKILFTSLVAILIIGFGYSGIRYGYIKAFVGDTQYTIQNIGSRNVQSDIASLKTKHESYLKHIIFNDKLQFSTDIHDTLKSIRKVLPESAIIKNYDVTCAESCGSQKHIFKMVILCDLSTDSDLDFDSLISELKLTMSDCDATFSGEAQHFSITLNKAYNNCSMAHE